MNCWACLFHDLPCQQPDPATRSFRKFRHAFDQGSLVPCLYTASPLRVQGIVELLREDEKLMLLSDHSGGERTIPPQLTSAGIAADDSLGSRCPICSEREKWTDGRQLEPLGRVPRAARLFAAAIHSRGTNSPDPAHGTNTSCLWSLSRVHCL